MKSEISIKGDGTKIWRTSDRTVHREDGPAVEWADGDMWWMLNNRLTRFDGPAIIRTSPAHGNDWYLFDYRIDEDIYRQFLLDHGMDIENLTAEDKLFIEFAWRKTP